MRLLGKMVYSRVRGRKYKMNLRHLEVPENKDRISKQTKEQNENNTQTEHFKGMQGPT